MIRAEGLTRRFGPITAVDSFSLHVKSGEVFGLVGPNGAGKTTALRLIASDLSPDEGTARLGARPYPYGGPQYRGAVGFMPENRHVGDALTVRQFLRFFCDAYKMSRSRAAARVEEALLLMNLETAADRFIGTLSQGFRQRVLLAKTILHDPPALLLDEPTTGMDPPSRILFKKLIRRLSDEGKSIVISSHLLTELEAMCDRAGFMENGRLVRDTKLRRAGLSEERTLIAEVNGDIQKAARAAERAPGVIECRAAGDGRLVMRFQGPGERQAALHRRLVNSGVELTALYESRPSLEEHFQGMEERPPSP